MKKLALLSLLVMVATVNAMASDPVSMTITLKNGVVKTYDADGMDSVRYVGGAFGSADGVGLKIYLKNSDQSVDYLYSQIESITTTVEMITPEISPAGGTISSAQQVTITGTSGSTIYYTTDDTDPATSATRMSGPSPVTLTVSSSLTLRAVSVFGSQVSDEASATFTMSATFDNNVNRNSLISGWRSKCNESWRLEFPHLSESGNNAWSVKSTSNYGITYSIEWDNSKVANRWSCYEMHAGNMAQNVDRTNNFAADPDISNSPGKNDYSGSGFSRGHLCPSADRLCSTEQNDQTFYMTNMQPQWQNHNGVLWANLEAKIRVWGQACDTLYVVKAATIDNVTLNGTTSQGVYNELCNDRFLVPKYFYMALLAYNKSTGTYQAMGLWTIHQDVSDKNKNYGDYAISIDELEARTGIDFFCNLPDDIEATVEATFDLDYWGITTSN